MRMTRRAVLPLPVVALVPLSASVSACRSAGIARAYMSRDSEARRRTSKFDSHDTKIYLIVEWVSGRDDAILTFELFPPEGAKTWLSEVDLAPGAGSQNVVVQLLTEVLNDEGKKVVSETGPWPTGGYEIDIRIDGTFEQTVKFWVN